MLISNTGGEQTVATNAKADYEKTFDRQLVKGMEKYGVVLKTFNGRDPSKDAFEELVDLSVYIEQIKMERQIFAELLWCGIFEWELDPNDIPEKILETLQVMCAGKEEELMKKWGLGNAQD